MYGGIGCDQHLNFAYFSLEHKKWKFPKEISLKSNFYDILVTSKAPLIGHSFSSYQGKGYIYGGILSASPTNSLQIINLKTFKLIEGPRCGYRRTDHAATMMSKYMFVHGGN